MAAVDDCDVLLSVGTSVDVYPAANLPFQAANRDTCVIQINPARADLNHRATFNLRDKAANVLPELLHSIWGREISHDYVQNTGAP